MVRKRRGQNKFYLGEKQTVFFSHAGVLTFDEFINAFIQIQRGNILSYELMLEKYSF